MAKDFNMKEIEVLSKRIDELDHSSACSDSPEVDELVYLAKAVKAAAVKAPQQRIDAIIEHMPGKKRKPWLAYKVAGAAAALLLITSTGLYEVSPPPAEYHSDIEQTVPYISQYAPPDTAEQSNALKEEAAVSPSNRPAAYQDNHAQVVTPVVKQNEKPSASQPKTNSLYVLPNRNVSTVNIDKTNGIIKQVYDQGTDQEITITQRKVQPQQRQVQSAALRKSALLISSANPDSSAVAESKSGADKNNVTETNKVTVVIANEEITIEGKQDKQKLEQLAQSLEEESKEENKEENK